MKQQLFGANFLRRPLLLLILLLLLLTDTTSAAKGRGRGGRRGTSTRFQTKIVYRNPASAQYYDNPDGARIIEASHFESDYILGRKITFTCLAQGEPRPQITWFKDNVELYFHDFFQVHEYKEGQDILKSKMEIDPATQMDAGFYECQAHNMYSVDQRGFRTDFL